MSLSELASAVGVSDRTARRWAERGFLPFAVWGEREFAIGFVVAGLLDAGVPERLVKEAALLAKSLPVWEDQCLVISEDVECWPTSDVQLAFTGGNVFRVVPLEVFAERGRTVRVRPSVSVLTSPKW